MKRLFNLMALTLSLLCLSTTVKAQIAILKTQGWFESGCVTWNVTSGETYTVFIRPEGGSYKQIDNELVRNYGTYGRADMVGLKAGKYQFKVESSNGDIAESEVFTTVAHDRSGFAHVGMDGGIGAYKNDGTLKAGAKVIYVHANNAKTITTDVVTNSKGGTTTATGLQDIIYYYQKGYESTPLDIRLIGTIKAADMDRFDSSAEGLQVKGRAAYSDMPITIEGIGDDATIWGFGILCRNAKGVEFRNFAIMLCMDDCLSLDTYNSNIWVHNMDFFYGNTGGDADQAKGDGTVDIKGQSKNCTVSYNHFYDSGKCSLGGMKSETTDCWMSYHHNWFDHSDSRHPRIRTAFYHVYNNYFDGNAKYGVGVTTGGSAFVEANYFRNCKYPMLISRQGTDATGDGTFSGEAGGVIKAFGNVILNPKQVWYYDGKQTDGRWDAVKTATREEAVTAVAYSGGTPYNAEADAAALKAVPAGVLHAPEQIPEIVQGALGAGRMNHGDFQWTFNNAVQDANYAVIPELKSALQTYKSTLVGLFKGATSINNGNGSGTINGGDGNGDDGDYKPEWGEGDDGKDDGNADDPETGDDPSGTIEYEVCYFTNSTKSASSSMVTINGNYSNSKGTVTFDGKEYKDCVKMETATEILIRPTGNCKVTLIFGGTTAAAGKAIKIDDKKISLDADGHYSFSATAGTTYRLTKGDSINLFLIIFEPTEETSILATPSASTARKMYNLQGTEIKSAKKGQLYIMNGKKHIMK